MAAALNPAGGASTPLTSGVIAMDALVAAVKAALPERGGAGRSGERGGPDAGLDLRTALKLRHAALFVLQECGLGLGDTAALVHVNQFRKCRVTLPKLGEMWSRAKGVRAGPPIHWGEGDAPRFPSLLFKTRPVLPTLISSYSAMPLY